MARWLVILAGGRGERFWPLSRMMHPKQFLTLMGNHSMIRTTRDRVRSLIGPENTWVVTGQDYVDKVKTNLPDVPSSHILGEPVGRNTAPSIAWAAASIYQEDPAAVILILPSDHLIKYQKRFQKLADLALRSAEARGGFYTFGIIPTHAETGYGYIEHGSEVEHGILHVKRFVEKPPLEEAQGMVESGRFLWNSGMFAFKAEEYLTALRMLIPDLYEGIMALIHHPDRVDTIFPELPQVSVDHGIMEKVKNVYVLPADIGWDDVGTFAALARHLPRNDEQNAAKGHAIFVDSQNVTAISEGPVVSFIGVKDLFVVATKDAVLILSPDRSQDVRQVVQALKEGQHEHLL
ncbi:mannose-1-phosphate guanylyltransferase [Sulfobacillus thermosulfidooxidans DSM 9293]|uniref:mannose-1-phosphate guanylyltransferase n=1 Tax=Sulfobacillus thermosulfidooxidans (strain DSM 9293 / VKM B-1269 / AT-1) TaxID=929705 RepID=A0A1W1WA43_SULTA|nr:mannose-1-phosphate guanylyltransferase [Sulfobacillus thermosulfidooxidans]SMC03154.1 mannose-1-phosphate guanylyltransferase [Sulfobacillus thermosulfidooxidans DSM 9293]